MEENTCGDTSLTYYPDQYGNAEETFVVTVLGASEAANVIKSFDPAQINMDGGATKHMTPCYDLENKVVYKVAVVVGNKQRLFSTHKGNLRLGNILFTDVLLVPSLMHTF